MKNIPSQDFVMQNLSKLKSEYCDYDYLFDYFGLDFKKESVNNFLRFVEDWVHESNSIKKPFKLDNQVNRIQLEVFFQEYKYIPVKWSAMSMGMNTHDFLEVMRKLVDKKPFLVNKVPEVFVESNFVERLLLIFPETRNRLFKNHDTKCKYLHLSILKNFGIEVEPQYCFTSQFIDNEENIEYGSYIDALTFFPVGESNQIWLNTKNRLSLKPDITSQLVYLLFEKELKNFLLRKNQSFKKKAINKSIEIKSKLV